MKSSEIWEKHTINHREIVLWKKIKGTGGETSISVDVNESVFKKQLDTLIEQKQINIGHLIMPKTIENLFWKIMNSSKSFNAHGRKISLYPLRKTLLKRLKPYKRYSDENYYQTFPMDQCINLLQRCDL